MPSEHPPKRRRAPAEPRSFTCRLDLWGEFEELARSFDCSVDFLINDAMRSYARRRAPRPLPALEPTPPKNATSPRPTAWPPPPPERRPHFAPPPPPAAPLDAHRVLPPLPPPVRLRPARTPLEASKAPSPAGELILELHGQRFVVDKDRYVIGRGKRGCDLTIHDPNVSRRHVAIERDDSGYRAVDLGSTNGARLGGQRFGELPLRDGDVLEICGHEIRVRLSSFCR